MNSLSGSVCHNKSEWAFSSGTRALTKILQTMTLKNLNIVKNQLNGIKKIYLRCSKKSPRSARSSFRRCDNGVSDLKGLISGSGTLWEPEVKQVDGAGDYWLRTDPFDSCVDMVVGEGGSVAGCIPSGKTLSCRRLCALLKTFLSSVVTTAIGTCHLCLYPLSGRF